MWGKFFEARTKGPWPVYHGQNSELATTSTQTAVGGIAMTIPETRPQDTGDYLCLVASILLESEACVIYKSLFIVGFWNQARENPPASPGILEINLS